MDLVEDLSGQGGVRMGVRFFSERFPLIRTAKAFWQPGMDGTETILQASAWMVAHVHLFDRLTDFIDGKPSVYGYWINGAFVADEIYLAGECGWLPSRRARSALAAAGFPEILSPKGGVIDVDDLPPLLDTMPRINIKINQQTLLYRFTLLRIDERVERSSPLLFQRTASSI